ncbi:BDF_1d_G0052860.mRNA.1.CDS.1 [Saccharomyces cerevisiae]|nr:BDF_1d_G0052860.mRNA.1.CDS.1 [Saccharomyces cerevisiae]CAI7365778.1 BDF_1d_G0052860.mRNA.1.CDS.1 [Saccharomyces cerevisiae]
MVKLTSIAAGVAAIAAGVAAAPATTTLHLHLTKESTWSKLGVYVSDIRAVWLNTTCLGTSN